MSDFSTAELLLSPNTGLFRRSTMHCLTKEESSYASSLRSESPQRLFVIFLPERFIYSPLFINLFTHLLISMCTHEFLSHPLNCNLTLNFIYSIANMVRSHFNWLLFLSVFMSLSFLLSILLLLDTWFFLAFQYAPDLSHTFPAPRPRISPFF